MIRRSPHSLNSNIDTGQSGRIRIIIAIAVIMVDERGENWRGKTCCAFKEKCWCKKSRNRLKVIIRIYVVRLSLYPF